MHIIKVNLRPYPYNIIIGDNIISSLGAFIKRLKIGNDAYVITNAAIRSRYGRLLSKTLFQSGFTAKYKTIPDSEESKSISMFTSVIRDIVKYDKQKRIFIVAFGGGVIGDLAGFVAAVYKRGIAYVQVPTTLLAQVDSSIGGKTGIDIPEAKNMIGSFYQPRLVFSDVRFLSTLSQRQIRSGLAEIIKYGIIKDPQLFAYLEDRYNDIFALKEAVLGRIIRSGASIKANIVQQDEREQRHIRTILNFGHTIGHAIEAAAGYRLYNHGESIALGMLVAVDISRSLNFITFSVQKRIGEIIKAVGLPTKIQKLSMRDIINAHYRDKKFIGLKNKFVLIRGIGKTEEAADLPLEIIKEALLNRIN